MTVLTVHPLRGGHFEVVGGRRVDQRNAVSISRRKTAGRIRSEGAILKGAHRIEPRLRGAVDEAAVDPAGHHV